MVYRLPADNNFQHDIKKRDRYFIFRFINSRARIKKIKKYIFITNRELYHKMNKDHGDQLKVVVTFNCQ
jgi:hypothetical protein